MKLTKSTSYPNRIIALIDTEDVVEVRNVSIVKTDKGEIKAFAPSIPFTTANGEKKYDKIVVFKDHKAADEAAAKLYESKDFHPFQTPIAIKGGEKVGTATLKARVSLKVTVLPETEDKSATLIVPSRKYNDKDGNPKSVCYVWPFTKTGDELKDEIADLMSQIIAEAQPAEQGSSEEN